MFFAAAALSTALFSENGAQIGFIGRKSSEILDMMTAFQNIQYAIVSKCFVSTARELFQGGLVEKKRVLQGATAFFRGTLLRYLAEVVIRLSVDNGNGTQSGEVFTNG